MPSVIPRDERYAEPSAHLRRMVDEPVLIEIPVPTMNVNQRNPGTVPSWTVPKDFAAGTRTRLCWLLPSCLCLLAWFYVQPVKLHPVFGRDADELAGYARAKWGLSRCCFGHG